MREYRRLNRLVLVATGPFFAALIFASLPILSFAFGNQAARSLLLPTVLLCAGSYLNGTLGTPYVLSLAMGRPEIAAAQNLLALIVVVPIGVFGVVRLGLTGAALGWLAYQCFAYMYLIPRIRRQCLKLPAWSWPRETLPALAALVCAYLPAFLLALLPGASNAAALAAGFLAGTCVYGLYALPALATSPIPTSAQLKEAA